MSTTLNSKELTLVYDSGTYEGKKALAYAYSLAPRVNKQDVSEVHLSTTFLRQVIDRLHVRPKDLMNRAHPFYQKHIRGCDYDDEGWLQVLARNPQLLRAPIAIMGHSAVICDPASNIQNLAEGRYRDVPVETV
jgi:arsenate reductase (glutaredoxin)